MTLGGNRRDCLHGQLVGRHAVRQQFGLDRLAARLGQGDELFVGDRLVVEQTLVDQGVQVGALEARLLRLGKRHRLGLEHAGQAREQLAGGARGRRLRVGLGELGLEGLQGVAADPGGV
ncbi:hypothetical protein EZJ19_02550 [Parasulfuritortus cantonensis]|uniref:Uncharacterized protein n=1 Tax=Parasulfuritortus cantonensis TaxID=2528202 RepID=A0A4R1BM34_9PROT|nr:hypothetical protein EZJ19_02550 [Parasulfuritortus cantonensis]